MALCGVMWRYEIGAFSRFLRFSENLRNLGKTVVLCGAMKLVLSRVFCVFPKICEIWEKQWRYVALRNWCFLAFLRFSEKFAKNSGAMWRYVALRNWCFFAFFAFFRKFAKFGKNSGAMWRYEIGAFSRFLCFSENLRNLGKTVALCGVMWRYEIGAFSRFSENL